tara:strand:- start:113 stop:487 length:375 start_codon:yes stop_codon:yes gene_type:complete
MKSIDTKIQRRATRTLKCLPFNNYFYEEVQKKGVSAEKIFKEKDKFSNLSSNKLNSPEQIESIFRWLIKVGILRREVDGQGLTSKIRLTPLGRQILNEHPNLPTLRANAFEKIMNWFSQTWPFR